MPIRIDDELPAKHELELENIFAAHRAAEPDAYQADD